MNDCSSDRQGDSNGLSAWSDPSRVADADIASSAGALLGSSPAMLELYEQIGHAAATASRVLIVGESGSGKDVVARALHDSSSRADQPFVAVNCGAIPESLIEAELFGYERGGFTGAIRAHSGYFERAADGTLLLDEIAEMPLEMQSKLLRALESGQLLRVGGNKNFELRCRVLAAIDRDPQLAVAQGRLLADLLPHLAEFPLRVPALRERDTDARALARSFLEQLNQEERTDKQLSADSIAFTTEYAWPGNVRELRNVVQRAYILADADLDLRAALVPATAGNWTAGETAMDARDQIRFTVGMTLAEVEHAMVVATLKRCGGNKTRTAAMLGVSLKTLYNRLNEYRAASVGLLSQPPPAVSARYSASAGT
jgi:DNA-binding NtrC family response regulator